MKLGITASPSYMPWRLRGAPQPDSWFGLPRETVEAELALVAQLRLSLVRFELPWALVEPAPSRRQWSRADTLVYGCLERGLIPVPILIWTPAWAARAENLPPCDIGWFAEFAAAAARRYSAVAHWEIWNEPNLTRYWGGSLADYAAGVLRAGAAAIRAESPRASVVLGSLAQGGGIREILAVERTAFDVAALHYYPPRRLAGWRGRPERAVSAFRTALSEAGLDRIPVWLTELGGMAEPAQPADDSPVVGPQGQVRLFRRALRRSQAEAVLWYALRDHVVHEASGPVKFIGWGVFDSKLRPRPLAAALRSLLS